MDKKNLKQFIWKKLENLTEPFPNIMETDIPSLSDSWTLVVGFTTLEFFFPTLEFLQR